MNVLVTGGAGFIGSHIVRALSTSGHQVSVVDDLSRGKKANLPDSIALHVADINSDKARKVIEAEKPDAIVHLAAQMDVRVSVDRPGLDADINVSGTARLCHTATEVGTKLFVMASSGGAIYGEQEDGLASERHPIRPESPYGLSKFCGEQYLAYYDRTSSMRTAALRFANVYGPRQDPHGEAGVVAIFAKRMLASEKPVINGDGKQTRDYVYVEDCVDALLRIMNNPSARGPYNIGTGIETSVVELANQIALHCGYQGPTQHAPAKMGEQMRSVLECGWAQTELDWHPQTPLAEGLARTVAWFRDNP